MKSLEKRNAKKDGGTKYTVKAKYTVYGYALTLQYWAYEAIVQVGFKYATSLGVKTPRMLCWTSTQMIKKDDLAADLKRKKVDVMNTILFSVYLSILYFLRNFLILFYKER